MKDGTYRLYGDGGITESAHLSGYWVAQFQGTDVLVSRDWGQMLVRQTVLAMLGTLTYYNVGVWTDKGGNKHLDYSMHYPDLQTALAQARIHKQIAIWDIEAGKEVLV